NRAVDSALEKALAALHRDLGGGLGAQRRHHPRVLGRARESIAAHRAGYQRSRVALPGVARVAATAPQAVGIITDVVRNWAVAGVAAAREMIRRLRLRWSASERRWLSAR